MYRQSERNLLNSSISSTSPDYMANFGPLKAEIDWQVWGTPANFKGFCVLASLLQWRRSMEVNKTAGCLAVLCTGILYMQCILWGSCPLTEFCQLQNSLCVQVLHSPTLACYCVALEQWPPAKLCGVVLGMELRNFHRGRHPNSAGRPSHWASAHILSMYQQCITCQFLSLTSHSS